MTDRPDFVLSTAEFDLVHGALGLGRTPFPLDVPSLGATIEERSALTADVYRRLAERDLVVGNRLDSRLETLLRLLWNPDISVDAVGYLGQPFQALAAADDRTGVLARIVADEVWLTEIRPTALAISIVGVLAPNDPGPIRAMSMPYEPLARVLYDDDEDTTDPFGGDLDDQTALTRAGLPAKDAAALTELASGRLAGGQFGVSRGATRASTLVTWFDTHQGRYAMASEDSWLSIMPADNTRIERRVAEVLSTVA